MNIKNLAILALFFTALVWGITLPLMKVNLQIFPPLTLAFLRFSLAATLALAFSGFDGLKLKDFYHIGIYSFFGISMSIGLVLVGLNLTSAIDATIILTLSPIVTSLVAHVTLKEKINVLHALGILLSFLGVIIYLVLPELLTQKLSQINIIGDSIIGLSVLSAVVFTIGSKKLFDTYSPKAVSSVSFLIGAISFIPGALVEYVNNPSWLVNLTWFNILSLIYLGVFSSFLAYNALEWGLSKVDVHVNVTLGYLSSIIAVLIAATFLHEGLHTTTFILSATLVGLGIFLVTKHKSKNLHYHHKLGHPA